MRFFVLLALALLPVSVYAASDDENHKLSPINHIIVFYLENHSFDNLLGTFPGADGIANAGDKATQLDAKGQPYTTLPRVTNGGKPDSRFPEQLPNQPFLITTYVPPQDTIPDLMHRFYQNQAQINGGAMNKFVLNSDAGGLTMGHYEDKNSPVWQYAKQYTLADHFFIGAFGGSMLNHFWLVCACTPRYDNAPATLRAAVDDKGNLIHDGALTPDGYAVNTIQPFSPPYEARASDPSLRLSLQNVPTIGERLSEKNISWAWYSGGWANADAGKPEGSFIFHHQPFVYFANYAQGTPGRKAHLKDETELVAGIEKGDLPSVVFYKPIGNVDMHPGYSNLDASEAHVFALIDKIQKSPLWRDSLIIVTFDDAGGFWDHVAPPAGDRFGPGERIPTLIISPFAKRGFIDHTIYDTTSILKLIETRYGLKPLSDRDANANDLTNALQ